MHLHVQSLNKCNSEKLEYAFAFSLICLSATGIPYKYEKPLSLKKQAKIITIRPDFTTLNKRTRIQRYHEHLGKMDDPQYARKALERIRLYESNGIFVGEQLILTFETSEQPLDKKELELLIVKFLI